MHSRKASFVAIDRAILAEEYEVEDLYQPGRVPNPLKVVPAVLRADLVFGWFASWHTFLPITLAWLLRKPSRADHRRLRHRQHARHRLRLPAGRPAPLGQPLDHAPRHAADHQLPLLAHGDRREHADPARAGDRRPPRRAGPVRAPGRVARARAAGPHRRPPREDDADAEGPPAVRGGRAAPARRAVRVRRQVARRRDRAPARTGARQRGVHRLALRRGPRGPLPARVGVRAGLAPRGLRPGGGGGDARGLRARW